MRENSNGLVGASILCPGRNCRSITRWSKWLSVRLTRTSQNPHEVWIAIGPKDRKPTIEYPSIKVVRYGDERFEIGLENHQLEGTLVRVYSVARTVVDLFSYRNKVGLDVALEALREGWRSRRFTLAEINRIAGLCRMRTVMKPYLESLTT